MNTVADLIQSHRRKAGLTQAQLAKLAGVGKTVVWDVEHGKESVQWDTLQKIFRVLNITVEWRSPLLERKASPSMAPAEAVSPPATPTPRSRSAPRVSAAHKTPKRTRSR